MAERDFDVDIDLNNNRIKNAATPVADTDVATKGFTEDLVADEIADIDASTLGALATSGGTMTGPITLPDGGTALSTTAAASAYLTSIGAAATYLSQALAASTYLTQANAVSTFLSQANAASTYLTQANAVSTYLSQATAASTYQPTSAKASANGYASLDSGTQIPGAQMRNFNYRGAVVGSTAYNKWDVVVYQGRHILITNNFTSVAATAPAEPFVSASNYTVIGQSTTVDAYAFGVRGDGVEGSAAANTTALQNAVDRCSAMGGGVVLLPRGITFINATIVLKYGVWLRGASNYGSELKLAANSNCSVIKNYVFSGSGPSNAQWTAVMDLRVNGNKANQNGNTDGLNPFHGIVYSTNPLTSLGSSGDAYFDPSHIILNVWVLNTKGSGIWLEGRSDSLVTNTKVSFAKDYGIHTSFDTHITNCTVEKSGLAGFHTYNSSVMFTSCKAYLCGQESGGVPNSGHGFFVDGYGAGPVEITFVSCDAQQNLANSFYLKDCRSVTLAGCVSSEAGFGNAGSWAGFVLDNARNCTITGTHVYTIAGNISALAVVNGATANSVTLSHYTAEVVSVPAPTVLAGSTLTGNFVVMNGVPLTLTKSDVGLSSVDNTSDTGKPVSTATQTALNLKANLASPTFTGTVAGITKTMVGLGNVDNTSDAGKPISTATQTALNLKANTSALAPVAFSHDYADMTGMIDPDSIPPLTITNTYVVASQAAMLALSSADEGDIAIRTDLVPTGFFLLLDADFTNIANWRQIEAPGAVTSVAGKVGNVALEYDDLSDAPQLTFFNAKNYGATGAGATDDSAAIQDAVDAATAADGGIVHLPAGTYLLDSTLNVPEKVILWGSGGRATILKRGANNVPLVSIYGIATGDHIFGSGLRDLGFDGDDGTATAVDIVYASHVHIQDVEINNNNGIGLDLVEVWDSRFINIDTQFCGGATAGQASIVVRSGRAASGFGSSTDNSNELYFWGIHLEHFRAGALRIEPGTASGGPNGIYVNDLKMESPFIVAGASALHVDSNTARIFIENVYLYVAALGSGAAITGIQWSSNGQSSLKNVFIGNAGAATFAKGLDLNASGGGTTVIENITGDYGTTPTTAHVNISSGNGYRLTDIRSNATTNLAGLTSSTIQNMTPIKSVSGTVSNASWNVAPPVGTQGVDTASGKLYVKTAASTFAVYPALNTSSKFDTAVLPTSTQYGFSPQDHGLIAWTDPVSLETSNSTFTPAGTLHFVKIILPMDATVTNLEMYAVLGGATLTSGQNFAALYNAAGTRLGTTADQSTAWATSGRKSMALAGGAQALVAGGYYIAFWFNGTTSPAWARVSNSATALANFGLSAPNLRYGTTSNTALTTTSPSTLGTQTAGQITWWAGLS